MKETCAEFLRILVHFLNHLLTVFSASFCFFCGDITSREIGLCYSCEGKFTVMHNYCSKCAQLLPKGKSICDCCLKNRRLNLNVVVCFAYRPPLNKMISALKFGDNLVGARVLGALLAEKLFLQYGQSKKPEVIIPVPLHAQRLQERGYNQALELAKIVARKLQLPIDNDLVIRKRRTLPQARLPARERQKNIRDAFIAKNNGSYRYVAIIDDVMTTGSTIIELAESLISVGVKKIDAWCVAKSDYG